jgi:hypothetical protein
VSDDAGRRRTGTLYRQRCHRVVRLHLILQTVAEERAGMEFTAQLTAQSARVARRVTGARSPVLVAVFSRAAGSGR